MNVNGNCKKHNGFNLNQHAYLYRRAVANANVEMYFAMFLACL